MINWKAVRATRTGTGTGQGAGYVSWGSIARGAQDDWIRSQARDVKAFGKTVYIAFHHEPEDDRSTRTDERAGEPRNYVEAFRHIRRVFDRQGAANARFVWILMASTFRTEDAGRWYPGSRSVDVVAADGYNWFGSEHPGSGTWRSFASIFQSAMSFASDKGKPFWVAETGVLEDPADADRKAQWYEDAADTIRGWAGLQAFVYFTGGKYGWWPQSSAPALKAFRDLSQAPFFRNGRG
jgi:beta-mannanase